MGSDEPAALTFICPACDEELAVNDAMREALVEKGCVVCGAAVTGEAFSDGVPSS